MKKYIPKTLQSTSRLWIFLGIDFIFSSLLYVVLAVIGISENISLLIAFLTLVLGILVIVPIILIHYISFLLKQSHSGKLRAASRREFLLRAGAMSVFTLAIQPLPKAKVSSFSLSISPFLRDLASALAQAKEWREAERVARSIEENQYRAPALRDLASALAQAKEWREAERVARSIEDNEEHAIALQELASALAQVGEREHAQTLWREAEQVARPIEDDRRRAIALQELASALAQAKEWHEAEQVAHSIEDNEEHAIALQELASALARAKEWREAEQVARSIEDNEEHAIALRELASALAQVGEREHAQTLWREAEQAARPIEDNERRASTLQNLASALAQAKEWREAERTARSIEDKQRRASALQDLASAWAQAGEREHAQTLWREAEQVAHSIEDKQYGASAALQRHASALTQAKEWREAEQVARSIEDKQRRTIALQDLASALAQAGERDHAQTLWREAEHVAHSIEVNWVRDGALGDLASALARAKEWREAERVILSISRSSPPPKKKPSSPPPSLDETIHAFMTSPEGEIISITSSIVTITGALITVARWWSKKHSTNSTSSQEHPSESKIVAIRLRMTHGDDPEFEEWLTEPDRLKHYIDVFNQPSSSIQPLSAIFVQRNGKEIKVDVSKGSQNNLQLDELLSYLSTDSAEN